jgi:hypothetical protein
MKKTSIFLLTSIILAMTLTLSGCAGKRPASGMPDWINGNSSQYPNSQYLIGRGQGEYAATARDRARADLAKIFEVNIDEQSKDITEYSRTGSGEQAQTSLKSSASRQIATRTEQTLSNIEIAEVWTDPKSGQHHALAVMDRLKAGQSLREDIQQLDRLTGEAIADAKQQNDVLLKLGDASRAVEAQLQRRALQRQLQVIDPAGMGVPGSYSLGKLIQDRNALAQRLSIETRVVQDASGQLQTIIDGALAEAGFRHTKGNADYLLDAVLSLAPFTDKGWHWYQGTLTITLKSQPDNAVRGSYRWDIKQASTQDSVARKRVLDSLDSRLKDELRQVIIGFANPQ